MPVITVNRDELFTSLGQEYTEKSFDELCFEFGIELDYVVEENGIIFYKIDLPANRYDLLCLEGLSRALLVFLNKLKAPVYKTTPPSSSSTDIFVKKSISKLRPFVVAAVLRDIKFTKSSYESFIALQEHLHRNICRKRTLVAIGTHDLDTVKGPFVYEGVEPDGFKFEHLFGEKEMTGREMIKWFRTDERGKHIKEYTDIILDSPVYPLIRDSKGTVLSLPPIINGKRSRITLDTKNVFIECTATDFTKANIVLNTVCAMFSQYCAKEFCVEQVKVQYEQPPVQITTYSRLNSNFYPDMSVRSAESSLKEINSHLGLTLSSQNIVKLCDKMQLGPASVDGDKVSVTVPVTRSDILHSCDIIEDVAIAYGFDNLPQKLPVSHSKGGELKINRLADLVRNDLARFGYMEMMSFALCSKNENSIYLNRKHSPEVAELANPKTIEFQVVRTSLIPGALKTLAENKSLKFSEGLKLFEVSDVVKNGRTDEMKEEAKDIGCRNERHVLCLHGGMSSGVEIIHGTVDRIMQSLAVLPSPDYCKEASENKYVENQRRNDNYFGEYKIVAKEEGQKDEEGTFFKGMCADIFVRIRGKKTYEWVGEFGALHPSVLQNFKLNIPCALLEINLQYFS